MTVSNVKTHTLFPYNLKPMKEGVYTFCLCSTSLGYEIKKYSIFLSHISSFHFTGELNIDKANVPCHNFFHICI
jgi:hypothetical protein